MHSRRTVIRVGLATSALLLAVAVASMWIGVGFSDTALITCGVLDIYAEPVSFSEFGVWWINPAAAMKGRLRAAFGLPRVESFGSAPPQLFLSIPLWLPLVIVGVPTLIAWRRGSKPPSGFCQRCGYDLTGNVSGRCPECGAAAGR